MGGESQQKPATAAADSAKHPEQDVKDTKQLKRSMSPVKDPPAHPSLAHFAGSMSQLMQEQTEESHVAEATSTPESDLGIRLSFTFGVLNACLTSFLIGRPLGIPWYMFKASTLLTYRFVQFKRIGHHYYLLDLCYIVNALMCIYCGLALAGWGHLPSAMRLFQALFAMTNGPLAWAIPLFNNKLKFHSVQHIISLFIHISPACTTYAIRWYLDRGTFPLAAEVVDPQAGFFSLLGSLEGAALWPYYGVWITIYYYVVFCVRSKRITERKYETLFVFIMDPVNKHPARRVLLSLSSAPWLQRILYLGMHLALGLVTMAATPLLWQYMHLHTAFLIAMLGCACWNASNGYLKMHTRAPAASHTKTK